MLTMLLLAVLQTPPVVNPRAVVFTCPDHAQDTGHEIDVVDASGTVIQTIQGGDPAEDAAGEVRVELNLQPVAFGSYTLRVRATAGTLKSPDSVPSDVWFRAPGQPGKPKTGGD